MKSIYKVLIIVASIILLLSLILNGFLLFLYLKNISTNNEKVDDTVTQDIENPKPNAKIAKQYDLIGYMYDSGLSDLKSQKISNADFQITFLAQNNTELTVDGYYLEAADGFSSNWGKCVGVNGTVSTEWKSKTKIENAYNRSEIIVTALDLLPFEECGARDDLRDQLIPTNPPETFTGTIVHTRRPSPDIPYDYQMILDKPYVDKRSASGLDTPVNSIVVSPRYEGIRALFEDNLNIKTTIIGNSTVGLAESTYFNVSTVTAK